MPLNDLSLSELNQLQDGLAALRRTGEALQSNRVEARFDLTPGVPASIMTDVVLPSVGASHWPVAAVGDIPSLLKVKAPSTEAAQPEPAPVPVDAPLASGEGVEGAEISAEPSRSGGEEVPQVSAFPEVLAESGGGAVMAAAEPPAAPAPTPDPAPVAGSASALAATSQPPLWTREEDDRLVDLVVNGIAKNGLSKSASIRAAALALGRPEQGTAFRLQHKLKSRLDAALTEAAMGQAQTETPEIPEVAKTGPDQGEAAAVETIPAAVHADATAPDLDAKSKAMAAAHAAPEEALPRGAAPEGLQGLERLLWQYLRDHRPRAPLTHATDLDLVQGLARGDKLPILAADMGLDTSLLKDRYRTLTAPIIDGRGNPSIEGHKRLLKVLRLLADPSAKAA